MVHRVVEKFALATPALCDKFYMDEPKSMVASAGSYARRGRTLSYGCRGRVVAASDGSVDVAAGALKVHFEHAGFIAQLPSLSKGKVDQSFTWMKLVVSKPLKDLTGFVTARAEIQVCSPTTEAFLKDHVYYERLRGYGGY